MGSKCVLDEHVDERMFGRTRDERVPDNLFEIGVSLANNQRQRRTLHTQKDVLPFSLC
jgi:hypothetical protein